MAANGRGLIDFLGTELFKPERFNTMLEQIRNAITSLTWADITTDRPFAKMSFGIGTFSGSTGTNIVHDYGIPDAYVVQVTPLGSANATLGEFYVEKGANYIKVKNTGSDTTTQFQWTLIKK